MSALSKNKFIAGLLTGVLLTLGAGLIIKKTVHCPFSVKKGHLLAEFDGGTLSRADLSKTLASRLVPIENDEYSVLTSGIDEWLEKQLTEKEAKSKNIPVKDLYVQEVWNKIKIPAENLTPELRQSEYDRIKRGYIDQLKEKYHAKTHLEKPESYIPGWALPAPAAQAAARPKPAAPERVISFTDLNGRPAMGPDNAPVTLVEFSDFLCPYCKNVGSSINQLMKNYSGKIRRVWRHYPLAFHHNADRTAMASECAHEQGKFWQYHDKIFETFGGQRDDAALTQVAEQIGLDKNQFQTCLSSDKYKDLVQKDIAKGSEYGVRGTPAFFINGRLITGAQPYQSFADEVEAALDPSKPRKPQTPPAARQPPPPVPAPTNFQFTDLSGRPTLGAANAPITLVEFSDFHCPFCKRVEPTVDQLMTNYMGKIRKVWRHYPLPFHAGADRTHEASECAHEQGKFWPYHALLIATVGETRDDASLLKFAEQAGVDKSQFQQCLLSGKYKELIKKEIQKGVEAGVNGTPAIFINGQLISGAQPYANFDAVIKEKLAGKK